ncbi:MAG: methyl-accepting chemotaxis protein [Ardenticatenales bacterium]|nr:methyl-accepting chemotaxis protein [Ardenticatenales bacterium]
MSQTHASPVKPAQRLAVRFSLTIALFAVALLLLLGSVALLIQRQQRHYRALALGLQTALLTEQLGQAGLRQDAIPDEMENWLAVIGENLARLRAGDPEEDLPIPQATTAAALATAQQDQARAATAMTALLAEPDNAVVRSEFVNSLDGLANSLAAVTLQQQRELDRAADPLLISLPLGLLLALIGLVMLLFQGRRLFRQQERLAATLRRATAGDYAARAEILHRDETGRIAGQLNTLLAQLQLAQVADEQQEIWQAALNNLLADIDQMSTGDLSKEADETVALTGAVAGAVNGLLGQFRSLIGHVQTATTAIRLAASDAQSAAGELSNTQSSQERELMYVRRELGSLKSVLESAAARAGQADQLGADIRSLTQQNRAAIDDTVAQMEQLRRRVRAESWQSDQLAAAGLEMGQVGELASDFAERANILALNSSVQAAMAGPEGKRLATFAQELEQLAGQAAELARQAVAAASSTQATAAEARTALTTVSGNAAAERDAAGQARQALTSIGALANEFVDVAENLRADLEQQLELAGNLLGICGEIAERLPAETAATQAAVQSINQAALHAEEMRASLAQYKLPAGTRNGRHKV